jgi:hypothetical protein
MTKDKTAEDIISEEQYTNEMIGASTAPEDDSPGDSEQDAGSEFYMGVSYLRENKTGAEETPRPLADRSNAAEIELRPIVNVPEIDMVVSSDQPSPWMDRDAATDTH